MNVSSNEIDSCPEGGGGGYSHIVCVECVFVCRWVYFLVKDYWGCAAGWGRIFTTRLTIMGLHF